jgi:16S rRNA G966 N2-methylase RsmD
MSAISKNRQARVDASIHNLREHLASPSTPEHLRGDLDELAEEMGRRFGLVYEDHTEPFEQAAAHGMARLVEQQELRLGSHARVNDLIQGENLVVLALLARSHAGSVDVCCIDPPYNTGMQNLGYRDHEHVGDGDRYPHSAWLSFMAKRLRLAHTLLSASGVLFLHVDEHEAGTSMLLCAQIFGEENVDVLVWPKTDLRFDQNRVEKPFRTIKLVHEYVIACYKDRQRVSLNKVHRPTVVDGRWEDVPSDLDSIVGGWGTTSSAKDELATVFGDRTRFQTPKPMRLIKESVRAATRRDSIVLDFFAGSGTTGHAVMDLNQEDGGERTFILVNNNENDICRQITYERLKTAIQRQGYRESLRYLTLRVEGGPVG